MPSYATLACRARTGARLWVKRYNGLGNDLDAAESVAISLGEETVHVTGGSDGATSGRDYAIAAYNAATGTPLCLKRYNGPGNNWDFAFSMAVSPAGRRMFITGGKRSGQPHIVTTPLSPVIADMGSARGYASSRDTRPKRKERPQNRCLRASHAAQRPP
jgi:hypothetical protein